MFFEFLEGLVTEAPKLFKAIRKDAEGLWQSLSGGAAIPALGGGARSEHLKEIVFAGGALEVSPAEQRAKKNVIVAIATVAVVTVGRLLFKPLLLVSAVGFVYLARHIFKDAWRAIQQRRVSINILHATVMTGVVLGGYLFAGAVTALFIMVTRWLMVKTEDHSRKKLASLFGRQPRLVWVRIDNGQDMQIPLDQLQSGQVVVVNASEMIPVDGRIISGNASIDLHMLTGEFQPAERGPGDAVFTSTVVLAGEICIEVEKAGADTVAAQIATILNRTTDYREQIQSRAQAFVDSLTLPMFALGGISLPLIGVNSTLGVLWNVPGVRMEFFGPLSMLNFLHIASHDGILIKDGRSLELLEEVDTVVFDKTGTLTLQEPHVGRVHVLEGQDEAEVLRYAAAAEHRQTHPIARAIQAEARRRNLDLPEIRHAAYQVGYGITVRLEKRLVRIGSAKFFELEGIPIPDAIRQCQAQCHPQGHTLVLVAFEDQVAGAIELEATVRPETQRIIDRLRQRQLDLYIISGDHDEPTANLARTLGIERYFANVLPENKARLIEQLQEEQRFVCFVGDGINDAIALKRANVSISIRGATTIATDTAQIVLMDESLNQLAHLFDLSDEFKRNMRKNFRISVGPSAVCMAGAYLFRWSFLTSATVGLVGFVWGLRNVMQPLLDRAQPVSPAPPVPNPLPDTAAPNYAAQNVVCPN